MTKLMLLGLGRWGANHLRALASLPVELFACDLQPEALKLAHNSGLPDDHLSRNYREFKDKVDAVVVVTSAESHFDLCREFLEAGKDVFVEKPITLVAHEARALAELADARARILQLGHVFRFDTATHWIRKAIQDGQFGELRFLRSNFSGFKRPRNDSGIAFADAIHFVDLFNYLLETTPRRVTGVMRDFLGRGRGFEDACLISLTYKTAAGEVWGIVETNYFLPGKTRELVITGTRMSAVCDFNATQYKIETFANVHERQDSHIVAIEDARSQIEYPRAEPLLAELQAFLHSVESRQAPSADGWAGYQSVRVLEAAFESARTGRTVELS